MEYKILGNTDLMELQKMVSESIEKGLVPVGAIIVAPHSTESPRSDDKLLVHHNLYIQRMG